jgi:hypothetical protein
LTRCWPARRCASTREVHPPQLPGRLEHLRYGGIDAFVAVADHQLDAAQATPVQERADALVETAPSASIAAG